MLLLVLLTSVLIAAITIYQYDEQTKEYNLKQFARKEDATKHDIEIELKRRTSFPINTLNLANIFQDRIYEIATVHKLNISIYDMTGCLLKSSIPTVFEEFGDKLLPVDIVNELANSSEHRILKGKTEKDITYQSSYSYINDTRFKRIGIIEIQITQSNKEQKKELKGFLSRLLYVYLFMLVTAVALAYLLSSYITRSIQTISKKLKETGLNKQNEKIILAGASAEINLLVESYNNMIDQLEESAVKLAQSEREQAWKEMAKQVAHEIKNPLTPMRLSVQNFERKFNPKDPKIKEKIAEYSKMLIQQIDVMSSIASAFSDFAKMPTQKRENLNVVQVIKHALDVFSEDYLIFSSTEESIIMNVDKNQLIRIITNLVKNAVQAMKNDEPTPKVVVAISLKKDDIILKVKDNGKGIPDENKQLIFEPKFTTKTSGMGLGLPMVKKIVESYNGVISFESSEKKGTEFTIILPKKQYN